MRRSERTLSLRFARRRAREFALQGLYQWQMGGEPAARIEQELREAEGFGEADERYFADVLHGAIGMAPFLEERLAPCLDRGIKQLSPIERGILFLAAYEFTSHPEIPFKVVINEAVELAKAFGGTDGHKYVNGVLDKLAERLRATEVNAKI
jgi:transcription antitermination protein NusB